MDSSDVVQTAQIRPIVDIQHTKSKPVDAHRHAGGSWLYLPLPRFYRGEHQGGPPKKQDPTWVVCHQCRGYHT